MKFNIVLIFIVIFISGCSLKRVGQKPQNYKLEPTKYERYVSSRKDYRTLRVQRVEGDRIVHTRALLYKQNGALKVYKYARWSDYLTTRLQQILTEALEEQHIFKSVVSSKSFAVADLLLESSLENFEEVYKGSDSYVYVKIRFRLVKRSDAKVIGSILIEHKVDVEEKNLRGVLDAYSKALDLTLKDLSEWLHET